MGNDDNDIKFGEHKSDKFLASAVIVAVIILGTACAVALGWLPG